jgi:hypothetical protein
MPRTKDPKGRYFHTGCYEEALAAQRARRAHAQIDAAVGDPGLEDELFGNASAGGTARGSTGAKSDSSGSGGR